MNNPPEMRWQTPQGRHPATDQRTFIIRCWKERGALRGESVWRCSLQELSKDGQPRGFSKLRMLFRFIEERLREEGRAKR